MTSICSPSSQLRAAYARAEDSGLARVRTLDVVCLEAGKLGMSAIVCHAGELWPAEDVSHFDGEAWEPVGLIGWTGDPADLLDDDYRLLHSVDDVEVVQ